MVFFVRKDIPTSILFDSGNAKWFVITNEIDSLVATRAISWAIDDNGLTGNRRIKAVSAEVATFIVVRNLQAGGFHDIETQ
ncbi:MAG: hypothetical protein KKD47_09200 [Proteobacteria bacterium]|nr:hypothetical protein [Pseudomonadota bacterium]